MRPHYQTVIEDLDLLAKLAEFHPIVIGTPPLGIATAVSDIDIACTSPDLERFSDRAGATFGSLEAFSLRRHEVNDEPAVVASFKALNWDLELFCQTIETEAQWGVRHFRVERRLLSLQPKLRHEIVRLKQAGMKTEPAFAEILNLSGDPYQAVLDLGAKSDDALRTLIDRAVA